MCLNGSETQGAKCNNSSYQGERCISCIFFPTLKLLDYYLKLQLATGQFNTSHLTDLSFNPPKTLPWFSLILSSFIAGSCFEPRSSKILPKAIQHDSLWRVNRLENSDKERYFHQGLVETEKHPNSSQRHVTCHIDFTKGHIKHCMSGGCSLYVNIWCPIKIMFEFCGRLDTNPGNRPFIRTELTDRFQDNEEDNDHDKDYGNENK